jgi:peptidylprolyl isomerase
LRVLENRAFLLQAISAKGEKMTQAKLGDTVRIHYTGKLDDGIVFQTSRGREPLEFKIGNSGLIPSFEQTIIGMKPGESRTVKITPEEAYGPHREEMVVAVEREKFPENIKPYVGLELEVCQSDGRVFSARVIDVSEQSVTLDANHPLAGKNLVFDIELLEIMPAPAPHI